MKKRGRSFFKSWHSIVVIIIIPFVIGAGVILMASNHNVPVLNPQGPVGMHEKDLLLFTLILSVVVVIPVFLMLGFFAWRYREGNQKAAYTPDVEGNRWLEALWWGIPILIIGVLSVVTWVSTHELDPYKPLKSDVKPLTVQVVALQWRWLFIYPEQEMATINELVIPAGTPVNFSVTADAPMSAFWIPSLGTQVYAMSGMTAKLSLMADNSGTFFGTNSNINGEGYSDMKFKVTALANRKDFDAWERNFKAKKTHEHVDSTEYETLAKPSRDTSIKILHLHNDDLYTEIINKYAHGSAMSHGDEHEDGEHSH